MSKFRVWDKENNRWFKPTLRAYVGEIEELLLNQQGDLCLRTCTELIHENIFPGRFEKSWCSGLKDLVDNEIYDGDIIEYVNNDTKYVGLVKFGTCDIGCNDHEYSYVVHGWYAEFLGEYNFYVDSSRLTHEMIDGNVTVVGNKWENSELLKIEKEKV